MTTLFLRTFFLICLLAPILSLKAQSTSTFDGTVFRDLNGDGVEDAGDDGIPGVLVELRGGLDPNDLHSAIITDASGNYSLSVDDLPDAANYRLRFYYPTEAFGFTSTGFMTQSNYLRTNPAYEVVSGAALTETVDLGLEPLWETASFSTHKALTPTNWGPDNLILPQSPAGYGVLQEVRLYLNYQVRNPEATIVNTNGENPGSGYFQTSAQFQTTTPFDEEGLSLFAQYLHPQIDLSPSQSITEENLNAASGANIHTYNALYHDDFIGAGTFTVPVRSTGASAIVVNSGNVSGTISTESAVGIFVVYIYEEGSLPVNLINFTARTEGNTTLLNWSTIEESNSAAFDIEHSRNGTNWTTIGNLAARGESTTRVDYTFSDPNPFAGLNYYRLKMLDRDGSFEYSSFVSVKTTFGREAVRGVVFPNPTSDVLFLKNLEEGQLSGVSILSPAGTTIAANQKYNKNTGIDIKGLPSGLYLLKYNLKNGEEKTLKFFVTQQ